MIIQREAGQQALGFITLGLIIISTIVLIFSTSRRLKVIALCVWVTGIAFLLGYYVTTIILE